MDVLEFVADPGVEEVYLGGAEPTLQREALMEILERLQRMGKEAILKTSGYDPEFLRRTKGLVDRYVIEIKCPLEDVECNVTLTGLTEQRTRDYLSRLNESLEVLRGEKIRIWIRIIPGFMDEQKIERIGRMVQGRADEAILYQFLSNPENDAPFQGISEAGPSEAEMVILGRALLRYVPRVRIEGSGFSNLFEAG